MGTVPDRTFKTSAQIINEIVAMAFPPTTAPSVASIVNDLKVIRLKEPDANGCNWDAMYKIGPDTFPEAIVKAKTLYNLSDSPAEVITTALGAKLQR